VYRRSRCACRRCFPRRQACRAHGPAPRRHKPRRRRAFGGATPVEPKSISPTDPAARYTAATHTPAVYAYSDNYLVDLKYAVIVDVEATTAIRQAEVGAAKTMLDRLVADAGYGSAEMLGWLVWTNGGSSRT
jgi:hypothetical protein